MTSQIALLKVKGTVIIKYPLNDRLKWELVKLQVSQIRDSLLYDCKIYSTIVLRPLVM